MFKVIVASLVAVGLVVAANRPLQAEDEELLVFEAALDDYLEQADFHCRFTLSEGTAKSFSDAMSGTLASVNWTASGRLSRLKKKLRFSIDFGKPALVAGPSLRRNISTDTMTNGDVLVWHELKYGNQGNYANVGRTRTADDARVPSDGRCMHPLNLFGGVPRNPLLRPCVTCEDKPFERQVRDDSNKTAKVETVYREGDNATRRIIIIDMDAAQPVVQSMYQTGEADGVTNAVTEVRASDFVQLGRTRIPRSIRLAMGNTANGPCIARQWKATEMRLPTKDDFVMRLAAGVKVNGFKQKVDNRAGVTLDLDRISEQVLLDDSEVMAALGNPGAAVETRRWYWWAGSLLVLVLVIVVALWWRQR